MAYMQNIRTGRHCTFALHAHLVFVTKCRHQVFSDAHLKRMEDIMRAVRTDSECELIEFNGESNHVHLLVNFPPKVTLSKLVNSPQGVSAGGLIAAPLEPGRRWSTAVRQRVDAERGASHHPLGDAFQGRDRPECDQ
ncbi:IS200/IS605 family transposase [Streptomyces sp. NPDC088246]|uniref:IS200/IS605 family transposase n=1 Tax=Streptomyces sp. NPDC088246 TaxID=3365842 RepID=UPI0038277C33